MKKTILFLSMISPAIGLATPSNNTYFELGGNAAGYSLNYERYFTDNDIGFRIGAGCIWEGNYVALGAPVMLNKLWGNPASNHKLETGFGTTYFSASKRSKLFDFDRNNNIFMGTASVGYKYIPKSGGITFKAAFTPIFNQDVFLPWMGFSVGHSF